MIQRRALTVALSMHASCNALVAPLPSHNIHRSAATASTSVASTSHSDDPKFSDANNSNAIIYKHLIESRPVRIHAKTIPTVNHSNRLPHDNTIKVVHFQRHGQGTHNQLYAKHTESNGGIPLNLSETDPAKNPLLHPSIIDAPLTAKGIRQCQQQYDLHRKNLIGVQRIIVSPLVRALQTAQLTFRDHIPKTSNTDATALLSSSSSNRHLHNNNNNEDNIINNNTIWTAHEGCREELGMLLCNKRKPLTETISDFPHVDFTTLSETDVMWEEYANKFPQQPTRESTEDMSHRVYDFLTGYLRHLPEREVAVVGHSAWLYAMCNAVFSGEDNSMTSMTETTELLDKSMFGQAEIRTLELRFTDK
eukprot:scaffold38199_cov54-Cyclotella_meneghiniana.AAC.3